jgi:imidazolonepropionase-like amidohydrolase
VVKGDPLSDIGVMANRSNIAYVLRNGAVVRDPATPEEGLS